MIESTNGFPSVYSLVRRRSLRLLLVFERVRHMWRLVLVFVPDLPIREHRLEQGPTSSGTRFLSVFLSIYLIREGQ